MKVKIAINGSEDGKNTLRILLEDKKMTYSWLP